jgi:hypothetical protein
MIKKILELRNKDTCKSQYIIREISKQKNVNINLNYNIVAWALHTFLGTWFLQIFERYGTINLSTPR